MKIGDLVFAKCTKFKPWPAKIIRLYDSNIFKVDFYNHNSIGMVDQTDIERVTFASLEKYRKLLKKSNKKDDVLRMIGIQAIEDDYRRRLDIENEEVEKWNNKLPTRRQEKKLADLLEKEIRKPVPKPSFIFKDNMKQNLPKPTTHPPSAEPKTSKQRRRREEVRQGGEENSNKQPLRGKE